MRRLLRYSIALPLGLTALGVIASTTGCSSGGESDPSTAGAGAQVGGASPGGAPSNSAGAAGSSPTSGAAGHAEVGGSPGSAGTFSSGGTGGGAGALSGSAGKAGGAAGAQGQAGAASGAGGSSGSGNTAGSAGTSGGSGGGEDNELLAKFSFFVTSMQAIQALAENEKGFGGDLRFGKADGLAGADEICRQTAELGMPGAGNKTWRAFLSVAGPPVVNARDRIGKGPWYDARGRLVAANLTDLFAAERPTGDAAVVNDLPNERGEPNNFVGESGYTPNTKVDNHDTLTGSDARGNLFSSGRAATCEDWTSSAANVGRPRIGHSWPRNRTTGNGAGWASDHDAPGCEAGVNITTTMGRGSCVGCSGGYGGIYCFELKE